MSNIIVVTGGTNTGKSELLTKLYETILRWYDNYELTIEKQPINSFGDFLADITIKINKPLKDANEKKYPNDINTNNEDCCCNNEPKLGHEEKDIRILINTAGDQKGNFNKLKLKSLKDYDFVILAKKDSLVTTKLDVKIQDLFSHIGKKSFSNNYHNNREKNLMCIMKEIVCYIYSNLL